MAKEPAFYPDQVAIDAYGNGGFRFAEMSHQGSILCLPSGVYTWEVSDPERINQTSYYDAVAKEADRIDIFLLGTGLLQIFPDINVRNYIERAGMQLEPMDTGAASRTYNVLLAEQRRVAAALISVI